MLTLPLRRALACLALVALAPAAALAAPRAPAPLSFERIGAALDGVHQFQQVALSPDGGSVAVVESANEGGASGTGLFVGAARDVGARRRVTLCPGSVCDEGDAAWSPDGRRLAFITNDARGQGQIAVAELGGGAPRVITHASGPISTPRWSPDGGRIAFLYAVGAAKRPSPLQPEPPRSGVIGSRPTIQRLAVVPADGGPVRLLGAADLNVYEFDWHPRGTRFAVSAAHGDGDANWWTARLYAIDAASGAVRPLHRPALQIASPRWSPDGSRIAFIGGLMSDESITGGDLYTVPAEGGAATDVTPRLDASVYAFSWSGPGRLLASELHGGETQLAGVDLATRTQTLRWHGPQTLYAVGFSGVAPGDLGVSVARDGTTAVIRQSWTEPPEIAIGPLGAWRTVTHANAGATRLIGSARSLTWTSGAYRPQGWLLLPPGDAANRAHAVVTYVHGGPAFAHYPVFPSGAFAFAGILAARGYAVYAPDPRGSYGAGEAFTRANVRDFGYGDLRDVLGGLDLVEQTIRVDPRRVGITGWSYGGYMTMWAITQTTRFRAAVAGAGLSDWLSYYGTNDIDTWMLPYFGASVYDDPAVYARSSPITFIKRVRTPTLLVHGDSDGEVPVTQSYEYAHALADLGVPSQFVVYPGEGHEFGKTAHQRDVARRLVGWFDRWLR